MTSSDVYFVVISGGFADAGQFDDSNVAMCVVVGGPHHGHVVRISTAKHNCGAYDEERECSCGAHWESDMNGCWQCGHQREEGGDETLSGWVMDPSEEGGWMKCFEDKVDRPEAQR